MTGERLLSSRNREEVARIISGDVRCEITDGAREYEGERWCFDGDGVERPVRFGVPTPTLLGRSTETVDVNELWGCVTTGPDRVADVIVCGFDEEEGVFTGVTTVQMRCDDFDL